MGRRRRRRALRRRHHPARPDGHARGARRDASTSTASPRSSTSELTIRAQHHRQPEDDAALRRRHRRRSPTRSSTRWPAAAGSSRRGSTPRASTSPRSCATSASTRTRGSAGTSASSTRRRSRARFAPLKIDGDFTAKTYAFGVYDRPAEDRGARAPLRLLRGAARRALRRAPRRAQVHRRARHPAALARSTAASARSASTTICVVDVPHLEADLDDLSPIGPVRHARQARRRARTSTARSTDPKPEGDIHVARRVRASRTSRSATSARVTSRSTSPSPRSTSPACTPSGARAPTRCRRPRCGSAARRASSSTRWGRARASACATCSRCSRSTRTLASTGSTPRMAARADVHVALGGPEDACGGGLHLRRRQGPPAQRRASTASTSRRATPTPSLRWYDRERGHRRGRRRPALVRARQGAAARRARGAGASGHGPRVGVHPARRGARRPTSCSRASRSRASIRSGSFASQVGGSVSGVAHVTGNLDDFLPDAGLVARAEVDVSATRVRDVAVPGSHLDVQHDPADAPAEAEHRAHPLRRADRARRSTRRRSSPTRRRTASGPSTETSSATPCTCTTSSSRGPRRRTLSGRVSFRGLDLGAVAGILAPRRDDADDAASPAAARDRRPALGGAHRRRPAARRAGEGARAPGPRAHVRLARRRQADAEPARSDPIELADDALTMPPLEVTLETGGGARRRRGLRLSRRLRADGRGHEDRDRSRRWRSTRGSSRWTWRSCRASCRTSTARPASSRAASSVTGKVAAPTIAGELHAKADNLVIHGAPGRRHQHPHRRSRQRQRGRRVGQRRVRRRDGVVRRVDPDPRLRGRSARLADHRARRARRPRRRRHGHVSTRISTPPTTRRRRAGAAGAIPHLTGDVTIDSFAYTRPITMSANLPSFGTRAKRTRGQRVRPGARRRSRSTCACASAAPDRHQEQPRRGAARHRLGHARGDGDQPAHRPARRRCGRCRAGGCTSRRTSSTCGRRSSASTTRRASRPTSTSPPSPSTAATPTPARARRPARASGERVVGGVGRARRAAGRSGASRCTPTATPTTCAST